MFIYVFLSVTHFLLVRKQNGKKLQYFIYPTLTIISCSSYIFTQIFENHSFDFKEGCFRKFCSYEYSRADSDHERVINISRMETLVVKTVFFFLFIYLSWNKEKVFLKMLSRPTDNRLIYIGPLINHLVPQWIGDSSDQFGRVKKWNGLFWIFGAEIWAKGFWFRRVRSGITRKISPVGRSCSICCLVEHSFDESSKFAIFF